MKDQLFENFSREAGELEKPAGGGLRAPRCVESVAILKSNTAAGVTTTLPSATKAMDAAYVEVLSSDPLSCSIRRREDSVLYTSLAPHPYHPYPPHRPQMVVNPRDFGRDSADCCVPTTTSLHDLAGVLSPARGHQTREAAGRREDNVSVYGTIRRGGDRGVGGGPPPHPQVVGAFLATSHQESAV
ncbi:hypothetical protein GWK47_024944 [Chionoecetes opilio]|uniref:Uncharacterized protein n=1 Tax=Chionoecetes opilio TaxID=41210 RepID=A0A8J5CDE1_CHIOP|nr:hypothetical protein GWK47_024944 [Chionoecetes opilio]